MDSLFLARFARPQVGTDEANRVIADGGRTLIISPRVFL